MRLPVGPVPGHRSGLSSGGEKAGKEGTVYRRESVQPGFETGPELVLDPAQRCGADPFSQPEDALQSNCVAAFPGWRKTGPSEPKTRFVQII